MPNSLAMSSRIAPMLSSLITVLFSAAKVGGLFLSVKMVSRRRLRRKAQEQLHNYSRSAMMKDCNDLKKAVILFIGKNKYELFL